MSLQGRAAIWVLPVSLLILYVLGDPSTLSLHLDGQVAGHWSRSPCLPAKAAVERSGQAHPGRRASDQGRHG
jgi:hypothetical protein